MDYSTGNQNSNKESSAASLEIEVKILEVNREEVENKLRSLGGTFVEQQELRASFLDNPEGFIQSNKITLRVRETKHENGDISVTVTMKQKNKAAMKNSKAKVREESEYKSGDYENTLIAMKKWGFSVITLSEHKIRRVWQFNDTTIVFDKYLDNLSGIPEYLEIEGKSENDVFSTAAKLGFSEDVITKHSLRDLMESLYKDKIS